MSPSDLRPTSRRSFFYPSSGAPETGSRSPGPAPGKGPAPGLGDPGAENPEAPAQAALRLPDGTELFYRRWIPRGRFDRALFLFHRGTEHSGRLTDAVRALGLEGTAVFAWDARGHGRSPGPRGCARSFAQWVRDQDFFVRTLTRRHGLHLEDTVILGHGAGAVVSAAWIHDYAPTVRAMILISPAFRLRLNVPFALPGLRLLDAFRSRRGSAVKSYVAASKLTSDRRQWPAYRQDPLITRRISVPALLGLHDTGARLVEDAGAIHTPSLILAGGADRVVHRGHQRAFFHRLGSAIKEMKVFPGMRHDLLHERKRGLVFAEIRGFLAGVFDDPPEPEDLLNADLQGPSRDGFDRLSRPLSPWAPKRWRLALTSLALRTVGRASRGIRLGLETGFDSGPSLDHVYENTPRGSFGFGRWIDRLYLRSAACRGIRKRRQHLDLQLRRAVEALRDGGFPARILDIAAGPGRHVLDLLARTGTTGISAHLREGNAADLEAGRRLAQQRGLDNVTFERAYAFEDSALESLRPVPNLAIAAGLFELFPDNPRVLQTLRALGRLLHRGGYLIYTNLPWHPQRELIARVLPSRGKAPWGLRCRSQAEMDELVAAAGFRRIVMELDDHGIFTVSLAVKGRLPRIAQG